MTTLTRLSPDEAHADIDLAGITGFRVETLRLTDGLRLRVRHGTRLCGEGVLQADGKWWHGYVPVDGCLWQISISPSGSLEFAA